MVETKNLVIGFLLIALIVASGIVYISLSNKVRIRVDLDKTTFYIKFLDENDEPYGRWRVSGREYNKFYDGTKLIYRHAKDVTVQEIINDEDNTITIIRKTPYYNGALIVDTYFFDGKIDDPELFPVYHTIEIFNGSTCSDRGCIYQWEIRDLQYDGETRLATSPESFGFRMKATWKDGAYYAKIFQQEVSDKLLVKYRIHNDYEKLDMRFFDPKKEQIVSQKKELLQTVSKKLSSFQTRRVDVYKTEDELIDCQILSVGREVSYECTPPTDVTDYESNLENEDLILYRDNGIKIDYGLENLEYFNTKKSFTFNADFIKHAKIGYSTISINVTDFVYGINIDNTSIDVNIELSPTDKTLNLSKYGTNVLIGRWDFVNSSADTSSLQNNGTVNGAIHVHERYSFDGNNDYINVSKILDENTTAVWLNNNLNSEGWTFLAYNETGNFTNGKPTSTAAIPFNGSHIGVYPNGTYFNGSIECLWVWNKSLTASNIQDLFNNSRFNTSGNTNNYTGQFRSGALDSGDDSTAWSSYSYSTTTPSGTYVKTRYRLGNYSSADLTSYKLISQWKLNGTGTDEQGVNDGVITGCTNESGIFEDDGSLGFLGAGNEYVTLTNKIDISNVSVSMWSAVGSPPTWSFFVTTPGDNYTDAIVDINTAMAFNGSDIGTNLDGTWFTGRVDSMTVHNKTLSQQDVIDLWINWTGWSSYSASSPVSLTSQARILQSEFQLLTDNSSNTPTVNYWEGSYGTCEIPSYPRNWIIDASDACDIEDFNITNYTLTVIGTGSIVLNGTGYVKDIDVSENVTILINSTAILYTNETSTGTPSLDWCYQETANITSACGGLDTGVYACSGIWAGGGECNNTYDTDWDTAGWGLAGNTGYIEINYTKPATATNESLWQVKDNNKLTNLTIDTYCWNNSVTTVMFRAYCSDGGGFTYWQCYNSTAWYTINETGAGGKVYEEAMYWYK